MAMVSSGSGNAALDFDGGELTRFEIDGDAVPGVRSDGSPPIAHVDGDWGLVEADFGYGPQMLGSSDPAPAGIGSTGLLPLVFDPFAVASVNNASIAKSFDTMCLPRGSANVNRVA